MTGKVVPLKTKEQHHPRKIILDHARPELEAAEEYLQGAINKAPVIIRNDLNYRLSSKELLIPALFLTIARNRSGQVDHRVPLTASLMSLHLALQVHCSMEAQTGESIAATRAVLAGDFFFSFALAKASNFSIFIRGMAEIISRAVSASVRRSYSKSVPACCKSYLQYLSDSRASLVALAATLGAWYTGLEPRDNQALAYFGHYLGLGLALKHESSLFNNQELKRGLPDLTLPLVHIFEKSVHGQELSDRFHNRALNHNHRLLEQEIEHTAVDRYMRQVTGNCFHKARGYLNTLPKGLPYDVAAILEQFLALELV
jgi:hypothetical protein